jgi:Uma2 family endonuclease
MSTRARATVEDLYHVPEDGKAELVNGELVRMSPTGGRPSFASGKIFIHLYQHQIRSRKGHAFPDNAGFIVKLPNRESFSPDAAYFLGPMVGLKFLEGAPIFAAEVRSEEDYGGPAAEAAMAAKRADYFAAGTLVVWDVDLLGPDVVRVFRASAPNTPTIYRRGQTAEAEPALPGWTMPVDELFG